MSQTISDQRLKRQIDKLLKHLPDQAELNGDNKGANFYRHINEKTFVEAHRVAYKHVTGLKDKFQLTTNQKKEIDSTQQGLIQRVEGAFVDRNSPPANLENFVLKRKQA